MTARILTIEERHLRTSAGELASLADFTLTEGEEIDPTVVVEDPNTSLYCLDDASRRAIFVQLPPGVNLAKSPFVYLTQGEQAESLIAVPYDAFMQLAAELPKVENLIPIYITGRSGSTLLSHALNSSGIVVSLSEPDVASQVALLRDADGGRDAELCRLIDSAVRIMFKPTLYKQGSVFALKFRNEAVGVMDLYQRTFPSAKGLFSYRDAVGFVTSFYRIARKALVSSERLPISDWLSYFGQAFKRGEAEVRTYLGGGEDAPFVKICTLWWLFVMEDYLKHHERGVPILAVRYHDLKSHREEVLSKIFAYCGLPVSSVNQALRAFEQDAQAGTLLARDDPMQGNTLRLTEEQLADVYDVLERHPVINTPDFVLPGTLEV